MADQKCLICESTLQFDHGCVMWAGTAKIEFGYGSRHDQLGHQGIVADPLLSCNEIVLYICDDCFDKKRHLMVGYAVETQIKKIRMT
jgi:hypothetical protein